MPPVASASPPPRCCIRSCVPACSHSYPQASYSLPVSLGVAGDGDGGKKRKKGGAGSGKLQSLPNVPEILQEFRALGEGVVSHIELV